MTAFSRGGAISEAAHAPAPRLPVPEVPLERTVRWLYLLGGIAGFAASFGLTVEKIQKLANPDYVPSCSLNPVVSCGTVMDSDQAAVLGFPNPLIGVAAFPAVIATGVVLMAGFRAPAWYWNGLQLGVTLGVGFVHWLIFQSLYAIHALCPYCIVVWAVTIPIFWYTTLHNMQRAGTTPGVVAALARFHSLGVALWYLAIMILILQEFWSFWSGTS